MKLLPTLAALAVGALAARAAVRRSRRFSYAGKVALVTGGSRGLGLEIARQLVACGTRVAICARTEADLAAAATDLERRGGEVLALRCDVRDPEQVRAMAAEVEERLGEVELLFNVAGVIQVGPMEAMTLEDFALAMDTHFWGPLHTVNAFLPGMRRRRWGRIVNIASLGGKRAVPHMLPYVASKFALVGLSNGWRTELAHRGILVTTVCPSLIRTGSPRNAIFKGQHRKEHAWFSIAGSAPFLAMDVERAAAQVLRACRDGEREVLLRTPANVAVLAQAALPGLTYAVLALAARAMPRMGGIGPGAARGYDSESEWSPSFLTRLGDAAARRNNEMRPHPLQR